LKKKLISIFNFSLFLLIGLFLLWLVFRKVEVDKVVTQILEADYAWVFLSFVFGIISHFVRALRWNILINSLGHKTKPITTFYAVMIGYFANLALPRLGEVSRCGVLKKKDKIPFDSLLGTVLAERVFDFIVLVILIFFVIVFQLEIVGGFVNQLIWEPLVTRFSNNSSGLMYLIGIILFIIIAVFYLHRIFKSKLQELNMYQKIKTFVAGFWSGMNTILTLKKRTLFFFYTFMIWFMYFLMTYVVFNAMDATSKLTIIDGITVLAIGSLGMVAPVPGGIGTYHFIVKAVLFEVYTIPNDIATSWATLIHTSQSLMIIIVGTFSYFMIISLKKKEKNAQAQSN
jgi:uncharacterized protein (TIRG00374 family)